MASHSKSKPFKCPTCKKSFGHQYYLQDHIRYNHIKDGSTDRKHICSICNKTFRLKINLTNHYRIHTGEKPFKCKNCNKAFTQKGNCDAHYRACIGIKPFKCNTCNKTFTRKMYLQQHERTHTGVKPFKCNICNKAFAIKSIWSNIKELDIKINVKLYEILFIYFIATRDSWHFVFT